LCLHALDAKSSGIDQEPFGVVFHGASLAPTEFWEAVAAKCYPFSEQPSKSAGRIGELTVQSQHGAFETLVNQMKGRLVS
jgi:hypothetical protein